MHFPFSHISRGPIFCLFDNFRPERAKLLSLNAFWRCPVLFIVLFIIFGHVIYRVLFTCNRLWSRVPRYPVTTRSLYYHTMVTNRNVTSSEAPEFYNFLTFKKFKKFFFEHWQLYTYLCLYTFYWFVVIISMFCKLRYEFVVKALLYSSNTVRNRYNKAFQRISSHVWEQFFLAFTTPWLIV